MAIAAPVIVEAMDEWVRLGGGNSGIVGNAAHGSGFHRAANEVPASDYSRRRDPNGADGPFVNWNYACAGDFHHGGNAALRAMHRSVLARLMADDPSLKMICEFIGQPWADRPVVYWARWQGVSNLANYTGVGHDKWTHMSWYRSRSNQRAALWTPTSSPLGGGIVFCQHGDKGEAVKRLQYQLHNLGYSSIMGSVDGDYQDKTAAALAAFVKDFNGKKVDGKKYDAATSIYIDAAWDNKYNRLALKESSDRIAVLERELAESDRAMATLNDRLSALERAVKDFPGGEPSGPVTMPTRLVVTGGTLEIQPG